MFMQMKCDIPRHCKFLIYLGDLQKGGQLCTHERFEIAANLLRAVTNGVRRFANLHKRLGIL